MDSNLNVVVIRADQLRRSALPCYGNAEASTPAIDLLAEQSVVYQNAYATEPVCSASRTAFDTGKHTHATPNGDKLHPGDRTVHGLLQAAGYSTFIVGKWHKTPGSLVPTAPDDLVPSSILRGVDFHAGHEHLHQIVNGTYYLNGDPTAFTSGPWRPQTYTDVFLAHLDSLVSLPGRRRPFYGVLDLEPPHNPYSPIAGTAWNQWTSQAVTLAPNVPASVQAQAAFDLARYYGMVLSVDAMVQQLMEHLDMLGLLEETAVIFTSDHGAHLGAHGLIGSTEQKRSMYREAIEIPLLVRVPGWAPRLHYAPVGSTFPHALILGLCAVPMGAGLHHGLEPAGSLYFEQLDSPNTPNGAWRGVMKDGHRYARSEGSNGPWVLFEAGDLYDQNNLVGHGTQLEIDMEAALQAAAAAVGDVIPW